MLLRLFAFWFCCCCLLARAVVSPPPHLDGDDDDLEARLTGEMQRAEYEKASLTARLIIGKEGKLRKSGPSVEHLLGVAR
jgi:hypothetical protein